MAGAIVPAQASAVPISYKVTVTTSDGGKELTDALKEVSQLGELEAKGAADIGTLVARARADIQRLTAALYETGRYGGAVHILIDGHSLEAVQAYHGPQTGSNVVPVVIEVTAGPVFTFGLVAFRTTTETSSHPPMDPAAYGLRRGEPAKSSLIVAAIGRVIEEWKIAGHPFARIKAKKIDADHETGLLNVAVDIEPGRQATFGWVNVTGARDLDSGMLSRYSGLQSGRNYSATDLKKAGERLRKLEAVESVRVVHGNELDGQGGVPVILAVSERKPRFIGALASMSTIDGGEVSAYWGHRNLFGEAERLKIEGSVSQIGKAGLPDLQYMAKISLIKPGILDIDTDLFTELGVVKERPDTYRNHAATAKAGLTRRFSDTLSGKAAIAGTISQEDSAFGSASYAILSLPAEITQDTRDNKLDPTKGWRAVLALEPALEFNNNSVFVISHAQLGQYLALDRRGSIVVAGRIGAASIVGSGAIDVPAHLRLYGGGGGSVRGYAYRSIGPLYNGEVVGGLGLFEGSLELRLRVSPSIGIVPFVDFATVAANSWPTFDDIKVGAGLGLRYYTALGPIRFDVAIPLDRTAGIADAAFYVGLGQSF